MPTAANQLPAANQSGILDTVRVTSTIPKAGTDDGSWVYPSPQMVSNSFLSFLIVHILVYVIHILPSPEH